MIYVLIAGIIIFVIAAIIILYCRFTYSAMLEDIAHSDVQAVSCQVADDRKL